MKKLLFLLAAAMLVLTACGETQEEKKEVSTVEKKSDANEKNDAEEKDEEAEEESYDEVLIDSDTAKVTLESISKVEDSMFDEEYHVIKLAIENKSDKTIVIQSDEVSIDGLMVTDNAFFS